MSIVQPVGPYDGYMLSGSSFRCSTSTILISEYSAPAAEKPSATYLPSGDGDMLWIVVTSPFLAPLGLNVAGSKSSFSAPFQPSRK